MRAERLIKEQVKESQGRQFMPCSMCSVIQSYRLLVVQESLRTDRCDATHHRLICSLSFYCPSRPSFFDHNANFTTLSSLKFLHRHCNYLPNINSCAIHRSYGCLNGSSYGMKIALIVLLRDSLRCLHTTTLWCREETKVEKTVKALRTRLEEEEEEDADKIGAGRQKIQAVNGNQSVASGKDKRTIWRRVVNECKHYYNGFRLLFIDIKVCSRLIWRLLIGGSLTRRERQQLVRTTADLFRLVPFLVFVLVPFMEFLLPVAIKLFPSMLPSTFAEKNKQQEKLKRQLKVKLQMAKFLQETIHECALQTKKSTGNAAEEFSIFVTKIRSEGIQPTTKEILKFAKLFEDEITLDNLSRQQLQAVCRVLNIQPIGIDALLRFQLTMKLRQLKADDKIIQKEGIGSLRLDELQTANMARGMRALGVPEERLQAQLRQWLTLHLDESIPTTLLLLSRALYLPETLSTEQQLKQTMSKLTESAPNATDEVKLKAAELAAERVDNKTRLEIIKHEEGIIAAECKARDEAVAVDMGSTPGRESFEGVAFKSPEKIHSYTSSTLMPAQDFVVSRNEELVDEATIVKGLGATQEEFDDEHVTAKDIEKIETALEDIADDKHINIHQSELHELKEEVIEYKEDIKDLKEVMVQGGVEEDVVVESKAARRLAKRVDRLIKQADFVLCELQTKNERAHNEIQAEDLQRSKDKTCYGGHTEVAMQLISEKRENLVSVNEMLLSMRSALNSQKDDRLQRILQLLDEDHDGIIDINLTLKVLDELSHESVRLSQGQVAELISLLKAEMELEREEKQQQHTDGSQQEEKVSRN